MKSDIKKYTIIGAVIFFIAFIQTLSATSVTIMITQNDNSNELLRMTTKVLENSLMDYFFNVGVIVSNEPINTKWSEKSAKKQIYQRAQEGNFEYVLAMTVNYKKNASKSSERILIDDIVNIHWEIVDTATDAVYAQGDDVPNTTNSVKNKAEAIHDVNDFAHELGKKIMNSLNQQE